MNKPPAFQFYVKDWRSSPTVRRMPWHDRGIYLELLAAAWEWDDPGCLPLPILLASSVVGVHPTLLRTFLRKYPNTFVEEGGRLVNQKLHAQYLRMIEKRHKLSDAGKRGNKQRWASQMRSGGDSGGNRSASASASAILKPPVVPLSKGGLALAPPNGSLKYFEWHGLYVCYDLGRHKRKPTIGDKLAGASAEAVVAHLMRHGYRAWIHDYNVKGEKV